MFTIVDDISRSPRSSDASLVLNWRKNVGTHPNFQSVDGDELAFVITHFADKVNAMELTIIKLLVYKTSSYVIDVSQG